MEKYTGAKITVEPMPAAGGTVMRNHMMDVKPDGLTIVLCDHGPKLVANAMFERPGVRYDWRKFEPIGKAILVSGIVFVAPDSPWKKPRDPGDAKFLFGESSPFFGPLFAEALGWKNMHFVPGYRGNDKLVAVKRGEIQAGMMGADAILANPGLVRPLVSGEALSPHFPSFRKVADAVLPDKKKVGGLHRQLERYHVHGLRPSGDAEGSCGVPRERDEEGLGRSGFPQDGQKGRLRRHAEIRDGRPARKHHEEACCPHAR